MILLRGIIMYPSVCWYLVDNLLLQTWGGWSTTLLAVHNSHPLRIPMVVEINPALADRLIGLVVVVQALKIKLGITVSLYTVCQCVHDFVCTCVYRGVCIPLQLTNSYLCSSLSRRGCLRQCCAGSSHTTCWRLLLWWEYLTVKRLMAPFLYA